MNQAQQGDFPHEPELSDCGHVDAARWHDRSQLTHLRRHLTRIAFSDERAGRSFVATSSAFRRGSHATEIAFPSPTPLLPSAWPRENGIQVSCGSFCISRLVEE